MTDILTIARPDDWHLHLRDGDVLARTVADASRCFARAIIMPNLKPPVVDVRAAQAYRARILSAVPAGRGFEPLMTLYLTDTLSPDQIAAAKRSGFVYGVKLYPAGATTNAEFGVTDVRKTYDTLAAMQELGMPLLVHAEVADPKVDIFDRERIHIETVLKPLLERFPDLKVVLEHATTAEAVEFVRSAGPKVAATITAHHLLLNRGALFAGGIRPHHYCLPILKREHHRQALVAAATQAEPNFFLGTDSAPHARSAKESACGCAGLYTANTALELYAEVFDDQSALHHLESFAAFNGADFYGLARNSGHVRLRRAETPVPAELVYGQSSVIPFRAGGSVAWMLVDS